MHFCLDALASESNLVCRQSLCKIGGCAAWRPVRTFATHLKIQASLRSCTVSVAIESSCSLRDWPITLLEVLLRSDGQAVACGGNEKGQAFMPKPGKGLDYVAVAGGVGRHGGAARLARGASRPMKRLSRAN